MRRGIGSREVKLEENQREETEKTMGIELNGKVEVIEERY